MHVSCNFRLPGAESGQPPQRSFAIPIQWGMGSEQLMPAGADMIPPELASEVIREARLRSAKLLEQSLHEAILP
jgi:hypothetical protein